MTPTLLEIPFDHYQRYAAAAELLASLGLLQPKVLEVGANRQRLLGQFLPSASMLYTDLYAEGDETDFIVADATNLPFPDQSFDVVVSLDVLEHIPAPLRMRAIAEMSRVSRRAVILGFPPDKPWVHEAEVNANDRWFELFGEDYVWLEEHKEFGLVNTGEVESTMVAAGLEVLRFGQGNAKLWAGLMGAHFIKVKFPELEPLVAAADRLYNSRIFAGDCSDKPYREYYIGLRDQRDVEHVKANSPFQSEADSEAILLLAGLAEGLRKLALRTCNSEKEWESTARLLDAHRVDLATAKRNWQETAAYALQLQAMKDSSDADWLARQMPVVAELEECRADLVRISGEVACLTNQKQEAAALAHSLSIKLEANAEQLHALSVESQREQEQFASDLQQKDDLHTQILGQLQSLKGVVDQLTVDLGASSSLLAATELQLRDARLHEARIVSELSESRIAEQGLGAALESTKLDLSAAELKISQSEVEFSREQEVLKQRIEADSAAYARSRRKWTLALTVLAISAAVMGSVLVWGTL